MHKGHRAAVGAAAFASGAPTPQSRRCAPLGNVERYEALESRDKSTSALPEHAVYASPTRAGQHGGGCKPGCCSAHGSAGVPSNAARQRRSTSNAAWAVCSWLVSGLLLLSAACEGRSDTAHGGGGGGAGRQESPAGAVLSASRGEYEGVHCSIVGSVLGHAARVGTRQVH